MKRAAANAKEKLQNAVIYEIYPTSFFDANGDGIGDLEGIIRKLDHVTSMGCNMIWLNPMYESPFRDGGYDVTDYYKVDPRFGDNDDMRRLFAKAASLGIGVMLDLVMGHTSDRHPWFVQSSLDPIFSRNEYTDRYIWAKDYTPARGELFIWGLSQRPEKYKVNYYSSQPALNYGYYKPRKPWQMPADAPACLANRREVEKVCKFWLSMGAAGFRVDMAHSMIKADSVDFKGNVAFWNDVIGNVKKDFPDSVFLSEWNVPHITVGKSSFDLDFLYSNGLFRTWRADRDDPKLYDVTFFGTDKRKASNRGFYLMKDVSYRAASKNGAYVVQLGNHDTIRASRGRSDDMLRALYAAYFTMPNVPLLYYGDEVGMRYLPIVSKDGGYERTGARTPMQWDDGANCGFSGCEPETLYLPVDENAQSRTVAAQKDDPDSLMNWVRTLIGLKRTLKCLRFDATCIRYDRLRGDCLRYRRKSDRDECFVCVFPHGKQPLRFDLRRYLGDDLTRYTILRHNARIDGTRVEMNDESYLVAYRAF